jgi:hypothetical protein
MEPQLAYDDALKTRTEKSGMKRIVGGVECSDRAYADFEWKGAR